MKKSIVFTLLLSCFSFIGFAKADKVIDAKDLPARAVEFIQKRFDKSKILYAKSDGLMNAKEYEVVLSSSEVIEFDRSGRWTEIIAKKNGVPKDVIPKVIKPYLKENHPEEKVQKIERNKKGFEIELENDLELTFNKEGKFMIHD